MDGIFRYLVRISFLFIILLLVVPACKDNFNSSVPYVPVSFRVDLAIYNDLTVPSNSVVFPGAGYGGVIVTNDGIGYNAVDGTCPYEVDAQVRVVPEGGIATCPRCGTQYLLMEGGSLLSGTGPSKEPLKPYRVNTANGGSTLLITN